MRLAGAVVALAVAVVAAVGCSRTKEDIVERSRSVQTRAELEKALGRPDDLTKLGPMETWTYRASNGEVVFVVIGDQVTLQAAGAGQRKPR